MSRSNFETKKINEPDDAMKMIGENRSASKFFVIK